MKTEEIIRFFDSLAPEWDSRMVIDEEIIEKILKNADICKGNRVLDVACGTGVMIPFYLGKKVSSVTGIDISPKMCEIAEKKFDTDQVRIICGNALTYDFDQHFDRIIVYNAFPHFDDPELLIHRLSELLDQDGILSIAHGMNREKILKHHENVKEVSKGLPEIDELKEMMEKELDVTVTVSDDRMYQAVGIRR